MTSDTIVASAFLDILRAGKLIEAPWALIGGEALIAYGVPKQTLDADILTPVELLEEFAGVLVATFAWQPLLYDETRGDYVVTEEIEIHYMDDPVLFDIHEERQMIPLRTPLGLPVELLAAQHPVEKDMIERAALMRPYGVRSIPVAPLGGVFLVKTKADRPKDRAALSQAAEHLDAATIRAAVAWVRERDPATADDLAALLAATRERRAPTRTRSYKPRKR